MIQRHRVPTIFNIYMLDVICCALGSVILLWQVNAQEAEQQTSAARAARAEAERNSAAANAARTSFERARAEVRSVSAEVAQLTDELAESRRKYDHLAAILTLTQAERDEAQTLAVARQRDRDKTLAALSLSDADLKKLRRTLDTLRDTQRETAGELAAKEKENAQLLQNALAALKKVQGLEADMADRQTAVARATRKLDEQLALLRLAEAASKKLEQRLGDSLELGKTLTAKLAATELRAKVLEQDLARDKKTQLDEGRRFEDVVQERDTLSKELAASTRQLALARVAAETLEKDKTRLQVQAIRVRQEAEQRFAGIALTGRNVIFLIDMSGSMQLIDINTEDPDKWPKVGETVAQLMRSLPDLERFQVILFSDRVRYLFGHEGEWLKFDGDKTVKLTLDTLKTIAPKGDTNMAAGFAETFRYKETGLDTVYFLSDGLPSSGEGLPANASNLGDSQKTETLSKYLRQKLKNDWNRPVAFRPRVRINTIGFFFESPDVGAFLWALAREHDGSFVGMSRP